MLSALCFIATAAMLFYVIRYRVHIHVTYTPAAQKAPRRRAAARETAPRPTPAAMAHSDAETIETVTSAIVNLGASRKVARVAAMRAAALTAGPDKTFEEILRRAIQFAQEKAA